MNSSPRTHILIQGLVLLLIIVSPAGVDADPTPSSWTTWRGDSAQTGVAPDPISDAPVLSWTYRSEGPIRSSAVLSGDTVFFGSDDGHLHALDRSTGKLRWKSATEGPIEAPPALFGDILIVGSTDGTVRGFNARTGRELWKQETPGKLIGAASAIPRSQGAPTHAAIGCYDGVLRAFEIRTGKPLWEYPTEAQIHASPAASGDDLILGGCDGKLHVIDGVTGRKEREIAIQSQMGASPAVFQGEAYLGHFGNVILGIQLAEGTTRWTHRNRSFPYLSSAAVDATHVILGGRDRQIHCLSRKTGEERWVVPTRGKVDSSPVIAGKRVIVGSMDGRLRILNIEDGEPVWTEDLGAEIVASPAVDRGTIFLGTMDGVFRAFASSPRGASR